MALVLGPPPVLPVLVLLGLVVGLPVPEMVPLLVPLRLVVMPE